MGRMLRGWNDGDKWKGRGTNWERGAVRSSVIFGATRKKASLPVAFSFCYLSVFIRFTVEPVKGLEPPT